MNYNIAITILLFLFLFEKNSYSQENNLPELAQYYKDKAEKYLLKNPISDYHQIDFKNDGLYFYQDSTARSKKHFQFFIKWTEIEYLKKDFESRNYKELFDFFLTNTKYSKQTQKGNKPRHNNKVYKVAISPGHLARNFQEAKYEKKYIDFENSNIKFYEADLNLKTALLLRKKLEKKGFEVYLTRNQIQPDIWNSGYESWKDTKFELTLNQALESKELSEKQVQWFKEEANESDIFKYLYARYELRERAKRINEFVPDISIMIHYNVDEKNTDWKKPTNKNYSMAFVPGSFLKNELNSSTDQFEFLRLLVTDDINESIRLSSNFIKSFNQKTSIPIAENTNAEYLDSFCIQTSEKGVYARNLAMTRLVHSPLLYGEPLYQDNFKVSKSLNKYNPNKKNRRDSKYIRKSVKSYYQAILNYFKEEKK